MRRAPRQKMDGDGWDWTSRRARRMCRSFAQAGVGKQDGAVSAHVAGLPVHAQAASRAKTEQLINEMLAAFLRAHPPA